MAPIKAGPRQFLPPRVFQCNRDQAREDKVAIRIVDIPT